MKIMFITGNKAKVAEISKIIPEVEMLDIDLPEIQDILAENIIKEKLVAASKVHKGMSERILENIQQIEDEAGRLDSLYDIICGGHSDSDLRDCEN